MTGTAAGLILGFLVSTLYGAGFHVVFGGSARRLPVYVIAAWVGFTLGHFAGELVSLDLLRLGAINLLGGSVGAWIALLVGLWLSASESHE